MKNFIILRLNNLRIIKYFNLQGKLVLNNKKYSIPLVGKMGIHHLFGWEPWLNTILKKITQFEKGTFVDIGANIGQTLLKIKSVSPTMKYIGFEPNPSCVHYLNLLIKINNLSNVEVFPIGISQNTSIKELTLYNDIDCDGSGSMVSNFRPNNKTYGKKNVPTFDLQTIKNNYEFKNISILKIDVEGMENVVLNEFKEEISKYNPIILIEILPVYSLKNEDRYLRQQNIEKLISNLDYVIYKIKAEKGALKEINRIDKIGIHSDKDAIDYIFVPKSKIPVFENHFQG